MGRFRAGPRLSVAIFLILVLATNVIASVVPKRTNVYPRQEYLEESGDIEGQDFYGPVAGYPSKQTRRSLDSLSGATFGENKRFVLPRDVPASMNLRPSNVFDRFVKRNIDEIDRTAFDSFFKRNLDEIDRVGWSGFVKRLDDYLVNRQTH